MSYPTYVDAVESVTADGQEMPSRFGPTIEMICGAIAFEAGEVVRRPNFNPKLAWMESVQVIGGVFDLAAIERSAPRAPHFFTADIAYGPRLAEQLPRIIDKLWRDPLDRQAVLHIGRETDQLGNFPPCATTLQFLVRNGQLAANLYWRSWDMVMGLPYDVWVFQMLTAAVALALDVKPGPLTCTAGSLHYYEKNAKFLPLTDEHRYVSLDFGFTKGSPPQDRWAVITQWARDMVNMDNWKHDVKAEVADGQKVPVRPYNAHSTPWVVYAPQDGGDR
jgi:hypothetical protein